MMSNSMGDPKVVPLQGVYRGSDGTRVYHAARYERCPPPAKWLSKRAKAVWRAVTRDMHGRGILTVVCTGLVEGYCAIVARAEELEASGMTAQAAEWWHEADETADALLIGRPIRPTKATATAAG